MDFSVSIEFSAETQKLLGAFGDLTGAVTGFGQAHSQAKEQLRRDLATGEASVRQLQSRLVELYALRSKGGQTAELNKEIELTEKAVQALQADLKKMSNALGDVAPHAAPASTSLTSMAGAMALGTMAAHLLERGLDFVKEGLSHFVGEGIRFNVVMESARLGIGALIAAQTQMRDESGRTLKGQEALNTGFGLADGVMKQLRTGSFQTIATLEELTAAYQQGLGPMLAAKVPLEDTTRLTVKFAQAAGALGLDINTLGHELRATFNGEISPRITKIAAALQISNEDIRSWRETGTLVQNLNEKLEFFGLAGEQVERSWRGAMSNLKHAMEAGAGEIVEPFQKRLQGAIVDSMSGAFDKNTAQFAKPLEGLLEMGKGVFDRLGDLAGKGIGTVLGALEKLSAWYERDKEEVQGVLAVSGNLASFLGDTLGVAFSVACSLVQGLVTVLGSFPGLTTTVIFALGALVVANVAASVSFEAVATHAFWAAGAVYEFLLAIGPVGWVIAAVGALGGAFIALAQATERNKKEQLAHAEAMHKSNLEANELNSRFQAMNESLKSGTLTLGERLKYEEEMRASLEKLKKVGDDYLEGLDTEKMSLEQLAVVMQKVTDKRNAEEKVKRELTKSELDRARAALMEAKRKLADLDQKAQVPNQNNFMDQADDRSRISTEIKNQASEVERLTKLVGTYGDEEQKVVLTLKQQVEMRDKLLAEEKDLKALKGQLEKSPDSAGADDQFKKTEARLKEISKELGKIKATGLTVEAKPEKAGVNTNNKFEEERIRLRAEELRYVERLTLEERKQAELAKVDLDLEAERTRTKKETEKKNEKGVPSLTGGQRGELMAQAEEVARKAKANIQAKYAEEERTFEEKHQLEMLQAQGRGLDAQILQRRQAALAKVEEMRKHGKSEVDIQAYQATVQAGIDRDLVKAADEIQEKLTTSQGRGWERRKALIEKEFAELREKMKALNQAMIQNGKLDPGQVGTTGLTSAQGSGLQGSKDQALKVGRADQVREDVGRLKQELAELAQIKGRALSLDEESEVMARFSKQSETAAEAVSILRKELHRDDTGGMGFIAGINEWLAKSQNGFQRWKDFAKSIVDGAESSFANFFTSLTQRGQTAMEKLKTLWMSFSQVVIQALMKIGAQELVLWGIEKAKLAWTAVKTAMAPKSAAVEVAASGAKTDAANAETGANVGAAVSGFTAAHAKIPFVGWALALGFIAAFLGMMGQIKARAVGGRVSSPEVTLLGEAGPEIVAPESDFQDWARDYMFVGAMAANLNSNVARQERGAQDYRQQAAVFAQEAQKQGERNVASGRPFSGVGGGGYQDFRGALIVTKDHHEFRELVHGATTDYERTNG